jgi:hypothetical protein
MAFNRAQFLIEVLGPDGALALAKAASRSEYLAQMIVPRTILAWLEANPDFAGNVPGTDIQMSFTKSEDGFSGTLGTYTFQEATIFHVAGACATAMDLDSLMFGNARNSELTRLGKSIDLMAKVHRLSVLSKNHTGGGEESSPGDEHGEYSRQEIFQNEEHSKEDPKNKAKLLKKQPGMGGGASPAGKTAGPVAPAAPAAPTATAPQHTTPQKPKQMAGSAKPPKPAMGGNTMKLSQSEANSSCTMCGQHQFRDGKFTGCLCFSSLAKSTKALFHSDQSCDLTLGEGWD